ncbi:DUF4942 domain-containing protein [Pseudomonas sp. MWU12-2115]|uniref:DUF4942 domain-containing protein n=1 Tax=unclassified Pseudomonas TaxID=196821 RepID=UPI000CD4C342|nr:DUF4942 domain-containing protein [Pseudomonas sp. MWU12-2020]RBB97321.1 DUF4942 domain-containing protein [Pseudomonas sp. MWU12-2115]
MSVFTDLAVPTTLSDLLQARDAALRLIEDARRITQQAAEILGQSGRYLMPCGAVMADDQVTVRNELDTSMWHRAFDLTGFKQLMDAEAVDEFEKSLSPVPPEFTEATIRATFIDLRMNAVSMFRRGVFNVFRSLSDTYRTNSREPFRIGRKVVMASMVTCRCGYPQISYGSYNWAPNKLNDLDRVFQTLDGKVFQPHTLRSAMDLAFEQGEVFENDYYRAKAYKNGNLHLEFKRLDLLDKVNEQIAEFYADGALPDARAA